jgi:putative ABC transport system substrate-binding protein
MRTSGLVLAVILTVVVLASPSMVDAQQARIYRVGVVLQGGSYSAAVGIKDLGLEEGKQVVLHVRDTKGDLKAVEAAASRLERESVDVIYAVATSVAVVVKRVTKRVPIVFYAGTDPVGPGLVQSFRHPEGDSRAFTASLRISRPSGSSF